MADKTLIIGLDGANWELLDPWIEDGELPNLEELRESAVWGDHKSQLPPTTFPNWKCYSTGLNPGNLGVYWFEIIDMEEKMLSIPDSNSFQGKELWDYLNDHNLKAGVINMPTMYPPKEIDGFIVCGGPGTSDSVYRDISGGYTHPKELEEELERKEYPVHPKPLLTSREDSEEEVEAIHKVIEERFELAMDKMEEVDVLHVTLFYLNVLQHFFWNEEPTRKAWKIIDSYLGKIKEKCDKEGYNLVLMSDHGCTEIHTEFYINKWLEKEGYYKRKAQTSDFLRKIGFNRETLIGIAKKLGVEKIAEYAPDFIQRLIPHKKGAVRSQKLKQADLDQTVAVASGQGPIYMNMSRDEKGYEEKREEIIEKLRDLESPVTDEKIFENVYKSEELYGNLEGSSPDIVVSQKPGVTVSDRVGSGDIFDSPRKWLAENKQRGMVLFYGKDFRKGKKVEGFDILDITPTVLHTVTNETPEVNGRSWNETNRELRKVDYQGEELDI
ncbi:MAG: alkaline phosphatase family protein [Candidatus Nanohaloarchaea archaeon]|nr:alkaline phosphatase family protein [Candidatus Nanohaloarchaea archaeon]